ncbi:retrovirus-related pol polyprotein from transposon TNT 1-94 [Tanacetum coccineum]
MEMRRTTLDGGALALTQQMVISPPCLTNKDWANPGANGSLDLTSPEQRLQYEVELVFRSTYGYGTFLVAKGLTTPELMANWSLSEQSLSELPQDAQPESTRKTLALYDIIESVISCETAKDTWTDLVHSFESPFDTKENKIMDLKLEYQTFKAKTSETPSQTYTRYKTLLNEVANDGVTLSKNEINVGFVNSLPEKFVYEDNLISRRYLDTKKALNTTPLDSPISTTFFSNNIVQDFQENSDDEADERTSEEYLIDLDIEFHERALLANSKCFIKRKNNFSSSKANEDIECYKCGKKGHFDEEEVSDDEEETRVQVLMALANDELSVGKNPARNGEWIDLTMKKMVENQNDVKVKQIRTNNGTEFRNTKLESFCDEKGISQNFSYPYTLEQNGVIERKNRTLIEAARTMLNGSILSKHFWTKADHLGKFDEKADDGYFFGYSFNSKAFRVFNTRRQQIEETYHVTFNESIKAIRFTNTLVDETGIDDSSRYPPNEFLQGDDPSR